MELGACSPSGGGTEEDMLAFWRTDVSALVAGEGGVQDEGGSGGADHIAAELLRDALASWHRVRGACSLVQEVCAKGEVSSSLLGLRGEVERRELLQRLLHKRGKSRRCVLEDVLLSYRILFVEGATSAHPEGGGDDVIQFVSLRLAMRCLLLCLRNIFPLAADASLLFPTRASSEKENNDVSSNNEQLVHSFLLGLAVMDTRVDLAPSEALRSSAHEMLLSLRTRGASPESVFAESADLSALGEERIDAMDRSVFGSSYVVFRAEEAAVCARSSLQLQQLSSATSPSSQQCAADLLEQLYPSSSSGSGSAQAQQEAIAMQLISLARLWHSFPNSAATDIHTVLCMRRILQSKTVVLSSAALAAAAPPALRLANRFGAADKALGSEVLRMVVDATPSTLLQASAGWLLPQLSSAAAVAAGSDNRAAIFADRALQVAIAGALSGEPALLHCHQLLLRFHASALPHAHQCVPLLLSLKAFVRTCPMSILQLRAGELVELLISLINKWHLPLQCHSLQLFLFLLQQHEMQQVLLLRRLQICVEMVRVLLFYSRALCSPPTAPLDLSGGVSGAEALPLCRAAARILGVMQAGAWQGLDAQQRLIAALDAEGACCDGSSISELIKRYS